MTTHPVFWVLLAAVVAPLLAEVPVGFRIPVVVLEVVLGVIIGPQGLGLVQFDAFLAAMFTFGMAGSLFMAGMELDWARIRGRPFSLAAGGWILSIAVGVAVIAMLHETRLVHTPFMVALALATTSPGMLLPTLRETGRLDTRFGSLFVAVGTVGQIAPIVAMALLVSPRYTTWQEIGFLAVFLALVVIAASVGLGARPPKVLEFFSRSMQTSSQFPIRLSLFVLAGLFVVAENFGFESVFGAFAAGMVVGLATRTEGAKPFRDKFQAIVFSWFLPFFFVGTGIKFDIVTLTKDAVTIAMVPIFLILFLVSRGVPVWLYRNDLDKSERLPFALSSSVASLSIVVAITEIGVRTRTIIPDIAAALVGAALLSIILFPTIASFLLTRKPLH